MEAIFGAHNWPGLAVGQFARAQRAGASRRATSSRSRIRGKGSHGAMPHLGIDPVPVACQMVQAFQTIITRNKRPIDTGVISVTMIHAGEATNVVPDSCVLEGTVRTFTHRSARPDRAAHEDDRRGHLRGLRARAASSSSRATTRRPSTTTAETEFARERAGRGGRRRQRARVRADDGRRGLQLLPAGQARLLLPDRQRRRRAPRRRPRHGAVHAAQPELRLQRRPDPAGRHAVGAAGRAVARPRCKR